LLADISGYSRGGGVLSRLVGLALDAIVNDCCEKEERRVAVVLMLLIFRDIATYNGRDAWGSGVASRGVAVLATVSRITSAGASGIGGSEIFLRDELLLGE